MEERDWALGAAPGRGIDELHALGRERRQRRGQVGHLEADVMEPWPARLEEPGDAGVGAGRAG